MNKLIFFIFLATTPLYAETQLGHDTAHFALSYAITTTTYGLLKKVDPKMSLTNRLLIGSLVAISCGIAKELYDSTKVSNGFSKSDLLLDIGGVGFAVGSIIVFEF